MTFLEKCCKRLLSSFEKYSNKESKKNRENITKQRPLSKKAIKSLARELDQMLLYYLKTINMQGNSFF